MRWWRWGRPHWERYAFRETPKSLREQAILVDAIRPLVTPETRLVDVGCGNGRLLQQLAPCRYIGIEYGSLTNQTRKTWPDRCFLNASIIALPLRSQSSDLVVAQGVLENLADWSTALSECVRVARDRVLVTLRLAETASSYR